MAEESSYEERRYEAPPAWSAGPVLTAVDFRQARGGRICHLIGGPSESNGKAAANLMG